MMKSYEIIWEKEYKDGYANCRVKTDSKNNIIACGLDHEYRGLVIKYDKNGNLLWDDHTLPKAFIKKLVHISAKRNNKFLGNSFGSLLDIAVDSEDNIIVVGSFYDSSGKYCIVYVKKYSPDGNAIWEKTLNPFLYSQSTGIDVDAQDNIFIAGFGGTIIPPSVKGFVIKLSKHNGRIIWKRVSRKLGKFTGFTSVVALEDDVVASGFLSERNDYELLITKFGGRIGMKKNEVIKKTTVLPAKIVDMKGNYVVVGQAEETGYSHYLLKMNSNFATIWEEKGMEGGLYDAAILEGNIVVTGKIAKDEYYAGLYDGNTGKKILDMFLGKLVSGGKDINDWMKGITVDKEGNIIVVGGAPVAKTVKIRIKEEGITEEGQEEKPSETGEKESFIEALIKFFKKLFGMS
ncbi:MAG: hypothetical protein FE041_05645 [Thermoplasmata archaeon]|nr:MAG: hypothetical protein FE041_05645 [Thermoplasmata archaeon]